MIIVLERNEYTDYLEKKFEILNGILSNEETIVYINEIIVKET